MKRIPLSGRVGAGLSVLVDDDVFAELARFRWFAHRPSYPYAFRTVREGGRKRMVYMHKLINGTPPGFQTDHISGDVLDNRRANLRTVTRSENQHNRRAATRGSTSPYLGVSWCRAAGKWRASATIRGQQNNLGMFATEIDAARARDAFVRAHIGPVARLNFPQG